MGSDDTKHVLIIGASGGIGNKVAETLLEVGYAVIGTYFQHPEKVENLKKYPHFSEEQLDLKESESISNISRKVTSALYAVVNCAGICIFEGENTKNDIDIWRETIAVNLTGNYMLGKILYKYLTENGRFIMISSTDGYYGGTITASYAASKLAVTSLTKSFSLLFKDKKIRVNSIAPGWVLTPMIAGNGEEFLQKVADINPLKRNAEPIDVANLIKFLLESDSDYLNGQTISLEGGYTNQDPILLIEEKI